MTRNQVQIAFEKVECILPLTCITPQHQIATDYRAGVKYKQIAQSILSVGLIEALVVYPRKGGDFLLLDGHSRLDILKAQGAQEVRCTLSTDDEAYTYNKRVNHSPAVTQHFMILRALENGVGEKRLAEALCVDVGSIRKKRDLLNGICPEAVQLLRHKQVAIEVFNVLRKMKPVRQVEAAEHMLAAGAFSTLFAKAILAVTKPEYLTQPTRRPQVSATSTAAQEMLGKETDQLIRDLKAIEDSYGTDALTLTVCCGYFRRMLANPRVERHLSRNHPHILDALMTATSDR